MEKIEVLRSSQKAKIVDEKQDDDVPLIKQTATSFPAKIPQTTNQVSDFQQDCIKFSSVENKSDAVFEAEGLRISLCFESIFL